MGLLSILNTLALLNLIYTFPLTPHREIALTLSPTEIIQKTVTEVIGSNIYLHIPTLTSNGLSLAINSYNAASSPPALVISKSYNMPTPISNINIIPLETKLLLSYDLSISSDSRLLEVFKSNLSEISTTTTVLRERGLYVKQYHYLLSLRETERFIYLPGVSGGTEQISTPYSTSSLMRYCISPRAIITDLWACQDSWIF